MDKRVSMMLDLTFLNLTTCQVQMYVSLTPSHILYSWVYNYFKSKHLMRKIKIINSLHHINVKSHLKTVYISINIKDNYKSWFHQHSYVVQNEKSWI